MPELQFQGVGHRLLAFGKELARGESAHFTEMEARTLRSMRNIRMADVKPPKKQDAPAPSKATHDIPPSDGEREALEGAAQPTVDNEKET